ncbi:MAG: Ribosomal RNA small subunit methyltransferase H [Microgenomates group bacterium LiPW_16]|nr:MAG: Ribosomal RNA small subunit methyltransferase H [Microgenomates group bacterium LiPW_16]
MGATEFHIPALSSKVREGLAVSEGKKYIDATVGGGGHTLEILKRGGNVLGIDCDPEAIECVNRKWKIENRKWKGELTLVRENFAHLKEIAEGHGFKRVAGILFDLGVSSHQLETKDRGFSFNTDAPLDMRMDPNLAVTAADLINGLNEGELYELFKKYSEEYHSWAIARAIVRARAIKPIRTCNQLAEIIIRAKGKRSRFDRTHPATKVFQALRIAVNDELNNLRKVLPQAIDLLEKGGRLVVLSFHSLEDRIVKNFLKDEVEKGVLRILTKKPIRPQEEEIRANPRSRSAKLRIAEKINEDEL